MKLMPRPSRSRVTLRDVGEAVGVSAKTVSNVVNQQGWVSEPVRKKVLDAIEELGYRPNLAARQLRNGTSGMIALVVPNLREPYFAGLASSFVSAAEERGVTVLVNQTSGKREREVTAIEGHSLPGLDAIVCSPLALQIEDLERRQSTVPLVLIGEYGEFLDVHNMAHIGIDNVQAGKAATEHLLSFGRQRIAVVGYQEDQSQATSRLRFEGYVRALEDAGIPYDPALIGTVEHFNRAEASQAVWDLVNAGTAFDGLVCFSDSMAFGALHTLAAAKISVPDEVRVIGFDNIEEGQYSTPPFDTVDPGADCTSQKILEMLLDSEPTPTSHISVPFQIISRTGTEAKNHQ